MRFTSFSELSHFSVTRSHFASSGDFLLTRFSALPMELESPDWGRSPSLIEEAQTDPYTAPAVKQEVITFDDVKLEDVKHEDTATTTNPIAAPSQLGASTSEDDEAPQPPTP